ncbi:MAG: helix-turn-helix transcriptional regulator [Dorea sp.]|jgi:Predicted transcriptional regulators|uniref:helix-turn-helix domain-containing protein n=1 Tax=Sporofaciens sp. JLR.KK001 TaxID=3112621 RepID=UPI00217286AA|nr:helix-turn-helix transcriptional regulator [Dorea sp.]
MNLAEKLTIQRKKSGMSQEQLAERLGITRQSVSKWEAGSSIPEISKLVAMSEIFRVSLDYLLKDYLDEEKNSGIAAGGCRNEPYGEKRSEANQQMDEDNSRLEKKVDDLARYIKGYQYTSKTKIAGIPLVSIRFSRQLGRDGIAKGIIAIGNVAIGVISLGACSFGIISFGSIAVGLLAIGALAFGLAAWGAVAIGVVAFGASAMGIYSAGASAWGQEVAVGVSAMGKTAIGETVKGTHCLTIEQGVTTGAQIEHFLEDTNPNLWKPLRDMLTAFAAHL